MSTTTQKKVKSFWIKQRQHAQGAYWVACGQLSKTAAKRKEKSLYGFNIMHEFATKEAYIERLAELRNSGEPVQ